MKWFDRDLLGGLAFIGTIFGAIIALALLEEQIFQLADAFPGGPSSFILSLAVLSPLSLFVFAEIQISARAPHMASATIRRIPDRVQNVALKVSVTVFAICLFLSPVAVAGETGQGCKRSETLTCWFQENDAGHIIGFAFMLWLILSTAVVMSGIVRFSTGAERRFRAIGLSFTTGAIIFPLTAIIAVRLSLGMWVTLAENWPGGVNSFAICTGLAVTGGLLTAVIGWRARSRWRPYWKAAVTVPAGAFVSLVALAVLFFLKPTGKDLEGAVCERAFPCELTESLEGINSAATLGFLVAAAGVLTVVAAFTVVWIRRPSRAGSEEAEHAAYNDIVW